MIEFDGYRPGCQADIVGLHAHYYTQNWGFGPAFEVKVASELAAFLARMDAERDLFIVAYHDGRVVASLVIDASDESHAGAHLRWFISAMEGKGLGAKLIERAMRFCDELGYETVWLTTFSGLEAARKLYERHGFKLVAESDLDQWQGGVREQRFERTRSPSPVSG